MGRSDRFWELLPKEPTANAPQIVNWETDFPVTDLWKGEPLPENASPEIRFILSGNKGAPWDYLVNPLSLHVCSERLSAEIERICGSTIQRFAANLMRSDGGDAIDGYYIVNEARNVPCLDWNASQVRFREDETIDAVLDLVLNPNVIPDDLHVFRVREYPHYTIVSTTLKESLTKGRYSGFTFGRIKTSS